jgi:hypothetical protein
MCELERPSDVVTEVKIVHPIGKRFISEVRPPVFITGLVRGGMLRYQFELRNVSRNR